MTKGINYAELADNLSPFLIKFLKPGSNSAAATAVTTHTLSGASHSGTLANSQAPQFALLDGSRPFTGNITFTGAGLVDGIDVGGFYSAYLTHAHPTLYVPLGRTLTAGAGLTGGGDLTINRTFAIGAGTMITVNADDVALANGSAQYQIPVTGATPFAPSYTALSSFAGAGVGFSAGQFTVGVANTGAVGLTQETDLIRLTSSSNPGAAASVLATTAAGLLTLNNAGSTLVAALTIGDGATGRLAIGSSGWRDTGSSLELLGARSLLVGNPLIVTDVIGTDNYVSQATGWRVNYAGGADFRYLFADEMHVKSFVADLEQALAGGQIITKSVAVLAVNFTVPAAAAAATLRVRDLPSAANMAVFQSGDIVRLRNFSRASGALTVTDCWGVVTLYADQADGTQTWTFTRSSAPNAGGMTAGTVVNADSIVLDYGVSGNGLYEVNAIDGTYAANSPYAQVATWTTHPATGLVVRGRFGKLSGLSIGAANEFGIAVGSGFTASDAYVKYSNVGASQNNVDSQWKTAGTKFLSIDPSNGITIESGSSGATNLRALTFDVAGANSAGLYHFYENAFTLDTLGLYQWRAGRQNEIDIRASSDVSHDSRIYVYADGRGGSAYLDLWAKTNSEIAMGASNFTLSSAGKLWTKDLIEVGTAAVSGNLNKFTARYGTSAAIGLSTTSYGYSGHLLFNSYLANGSISYRASGAMKYLGGQYTGNVTAPGMLSFDGNGNRFTFYMGETGLASGADITTWDDIFSIMRTNFDSHVRGAIRQESTTGAASVVDLQQSDLSEEFINFITTVGAGNAIDTAALGTYYGKARVAVNGTFKYIGLYNS